MKKKKLLLIATAVVAVCGGIILAADHIDSPAVTNQPSDITDLYVFRGENPDNLVFVANTQGLLSPASTANAKFDENTMIEINIDNNGDHVEDLVIQCIAKNGMMRVYGPFKPSVTGTTSYLGINNFTAQVEITPYGQPAIIAEQKGVKVFAGPRDDPFFFDLVRFRQIIAGTATSFNNPGNDTFAGTNVLGLVVELPKTMLGGNGTIDVWAETKKKTNTQ
ncbi:MAG: DUF4331 domain-containing protein [Bacteroidetes bacterium]|nr:MAG: DUF4331 domain-containing protein [Bacteroidota bacterium]